MIGRFLDWLTPKNPWLVMLPFLVFYLFLAFTLTDHSELQRDEVRYWGLADNLLHGHFHDKGGDNFLWSGPGYPIVLAPFVAIGAPLWLPKMFNGAIYYVAMVMFFYLVALYLPRRKAWIAALCMLAYYVPWNECMGDIMTESLALCLSITTCYFFCKAILEGRFGWKDMLKPGLFLAWLMLTKVIFGYVVLAFMLLMGLAALLRRSNLKLMASFRLAAFGMLFCLPYLIYTYAVSGKVFYWSNAGGMQLYWMSSPFPDELGDWHVASLQEHPSLEQNHRAFFDEIKGLDPVAKDAAFKKKAIENIKAHPTKFVKNWAMNMTRIVFSHPLSFLKPSLGVFKYVLPHSFLIVLGLLLIGPCWRYREQFPLEITLLLVMMGIYFMGSSLLAAYARFFFPIVPVCVLAIGVALNRFVRIEGGK